MAGIGFELRKIFGRKTLAAHVWGSLYATMTTIGPSILFAALLLIINWGIERCGGTEIEKTFFISSLVYISLIAILVSALFNPVLSRYISDRIFENKEEDIGASLFGVLAISSVISGILGAALCLALYYFDHIPLSFLMVYYWFCVCMSHTYILITYISALKKYKEVTFSYLIGVFITLGVFLIGYEYGHIPLIFAVYIGLTLGFLVTNVSLVYQCIRAFGWPMHRYFDFLPYFRRYPGLMMSGITYILGFYSSSIIYWFFSDMQVKIGIFRTTPQYDAALFLALIINLPSLVIFVVKVETVFYEKYIVYLSALNKGSFEIIEKERKSMVDTINLQLFFIYEIQFIITVICICLINIFFPYLGISSDILNNFMVLGIGIYCVFCMYITIIFLYYYEDYKSACIAGSTFFIVATFVAIIIVSIGAPYYSLPILVGGIVGWVISFTLLRKRLHHLNAFLVCR
ncbi:MAG: exopolysaccharide Pel transporter PelG [Niameybacter sp.]|nr:exopolysaccharide Pel transporter PelG [Niameybacter sp.]